MAMRTERRGSFPCIGSDGNRYIVYREVYVQIETLRGEAVERDGTTVFRCNGHTVGHVGKGRYRTYTGVELTARDPKAP